jgi:hypothetical protein
MLKRSPMNRTGVLRVASHDLEARPVAGPRQKTCQSCRLKFTPVLGNAKVCSVACSVKFVEMVKAKTARKKAKAVRAADKASIEAMQPLEYWLKAAQRAFNAWTIKRDAALPCISCGRSNADVWNAGHYVSVGACRTIRFNPDNVHKQCARPSNMDLAGNAIKYRVGLIAKIGVERVEALESWHKPVKLTIDQAKAIGIEYRAKIKELQ